MTTQTQPNITQPIIWLVVALVVIVALSYYFVW
jgi:F0F1-type ATP synthase membrane subunit b/b'